MDFDLSDLVNNQLAIGGAWRNTLASNGDALSGVSAPAGVGTSVNPGPYLTGAGGVVSALAAIQQGRTTAQLMKVNASIAGAQAASESDAGAQQAEQYRQHLNQVLGKDAAAVGASNLTMSGSPLRALSSTAQIGATDIDRIMANSSRKAWGFRVQQASDLYRSKEASTGGWMNGLGGLITTGARAYGQWSQDYG